MPTGGLVNSTGLPAGRGFTTPSGLNALPIAIQSMVEPATSRSEVPREPLTHPRPVWVLVVRPSTLPI